MKTEANLKKCCKSETLRAGGTYLPLRGWLAGTPDALVILAGKLYLVEFKTIFGKLSPGQESLHRKIAAAGATVHVVRTKEDFIRMLEPHHEPLR